MEQKTCKASRVIQTDLVLPNDTNNHNTMFGGVLMKKIDAVASISARRHCRKEVVTASTDSVDFLEPVYPTDSICLESVVTWTGKTSMEVFVKVVAEDLITGHRRIAATAFLTFVVVKDIAGNRAPVPQVVPESDEEKFLHATAEERANYRQTRRKSSTELARNLSTLKL
jgi:acyl-CoA hydrolase